MERDGSARVARWSSHRVFVIAAVGATVGLGNVWRFPHLVAEFGGSAFVLVYLLALLLLGLPLLLAELVLARRTHGALSATFTAEIRAAQLARGWHFLPWLTLIAAWLVLAGLLVIGGWLLAYLATAIGGGFAGITAHGVALRFDALARAPEVGIGWLTLFLGSAVAVSAIGVRRGLERVVKAGLSLVIGSWLLVLVFLQFGAQPGAGLSRMMAFDPGQLGVDGILAAMSQAFFTLTLGAGVMHAYGVHLPPGGSLPGMALRVVLGDTVLALLVAALVFALLATTGQDVTAGPVLLFGTMPTALGELPGGGWLAVLLYGSFALVAWLTSLALLEPLVLALATGFRCGRFRAALLVGLSLWSAGLLLVISFAFSPGGRWIGHGPFGWVEFTGGRLLVPLSALLLALFVGWLLPEPERRGVLALVPERTYRAWRALLRYAVPPLLLLVFLAGAGILRGPL
jgi:NSS family neurotransmitter:Na+ symporter